MIFPHELELRAKRRRTFTAVAVLVVLFGLITYFLVPHGGVTDSGEPRYQGRYLSAWLDDYANPLRSVHSRADLGKINIKAKFQRSQQAVLAIGTNAIPTLLKLLQAQDTGVEKLPRHSEFMLTAREQHDMAQAGFMILQKQAMAAVPELTKLTNDQDPGV
jgi:hypothetical protein